MAGWLVILTGWPATAGVIEVGVVNTHQPGADAAHMGWLGVVTGISADSTGGVLVKYAKRNGPMVGTKF